MLNVAINIVYVSLAVYFLYHRFYTGVLALITIGSVLYSNALSFIGISSGFLPIRYFVIISLVALTIYESREIIKIYNYKIIALLLGLVALITITNFYSDLPVSSVSPTFIRNIYVYTFIPAILFGYLFFIHYDIDKLLLAFLAIGILVSLFLLGNFSIGFFFQTGREFFDDITGLDTIGMSRLISLPLIVSFIFLLDEDKEKWIRVVSAFIVAVSILLVFTMGQRATVLGLTLALLAFYLFTNVDIVRKASNLVLFSALVFFVIVIVGLDNLFILDRFQELSSFASIQQMERFYDYLETWELAKQNYFVLGAGSMGYAFFTNLLRPYPHSILLESLSDYGLIGLLLILAIIYYAVVYSIYIFKNGAHSEKAIPMLFIVSLVSALFSGSYETNDYFFTFVALLSPVYHHVRTRIE